MNKDDYNEIINGIKTYKAIAEKLLKARSVIIGWTDEDMTHYDILFTYGAYKEMDNLLQRGLHGRELFVSIIGKGSFGFNVDSYDKEAGYVGQKLNVTGKETNEKLAELINEIISFIHK